MPLFVHESLKKSQAIPTMPGIFQHDQDSALQEIIKYQQLGLAGTIIFGIPQHKDACATGAWSENGIVQTLIRKAKREGCTIPLIADTCLCEYTSDGQCGPLSNQVVDNDRALELLSKTAVSQAQAGADIIAPSIMIDGMISAVREAMDNEGFANVPILSYAAKFASNFYGPFRDAAGSGESFKGDRKNHQMDFANGREAQQELYQDYLEGADILMVKPALSYLDIVHQAKIHGLPVWAYNVSGEYAMVKNAEKSGMRSDSLRYEILTCIKRAGADRIISYHASEFAADWRL